MLISKAPEMRLTIPQIFKINAPPPHPNPPPHRNPGSHERKAEERITKYFRTFKVWWKLATCTLIYSMFSLHDKLLAFAI